MGSYTDKAGFPLIFAETENVNPLQTLFFRFFQQGRQGNLFPVRIIQAETFRCDVQDCVRALLLLHFLQADDGRIRLEHIFHSCKSRDICGRKKGGKQGMQYFAQERRSF